MQLEMIQKYYSLVIVIRAQLRLSFHAIFHPFYCSNYTWVHHAVIIRLQKVSGRVKGKICSIRYTSCEKQGGHLEI